MRLIPFLSLCSLLAALTAHAKQRSGSACPKLDYRAHFSISEDQREFGTCYAFVVKALFEEQLCLEKRARCGQRFSVVDVTRCAGFSVEGGDPVLALACALETGLCPERSAPYEHVPFEPGRSEAERTKVSFSRARHLSSHARCAGNRVAPKQALRVAEEELGDLSDEEKLGTLRRALLGGRGVGLFQKGRAFNHGVAVTAMRWNAIKARCEIWVQDSAGTDDWQPALEYLEKVYRIFRIVPGEPGTR